MSQSQGSIFAKALAHVTSTVDANKKAELQKLDARLNDIRRAESVAMAAIDKSDQPNHDKRLAKAQCHVDAQVAENEVIKAIYALDPSRGVTSSEIALKLGAQLISKAQNASEKVGVVAGVAASPLSSLYNGLRNGLSARFETVKKELGA